MMYHQNQSKNVCWPISISVLQMALAAMLTLTPITHAAVVFSDGEFNLDNWDTTKLYKGSGGSISLSQQTTGGIPGEFVQINHVLNPDSALYGTYIRSGAAYNPATDGAIVSIDFSINYKNFQTSAAGVGFGIALIQDEQIYYDFRSLSGTVTGWQLDQKYNLQVENFGLLVDTGNLYVSDFNQNPDFGPTGSMLEFGFFTYRSGSTNQNVGFDNWMVSIEPVPEPTTFALLTLGGLLFKKRRTIPT